MDVYLVFALTGLATGALYAGLGASLIVAYKGTGVINFAQGALAMWGAYVYDELRRSGDLVLPVVGVPGRLDLGAELAAAPAAMLGVLSAAAVAAAAHAVVFRPLRRAPALGRVVASVGVMLTLQAVATLRFGSEERVVSGFLSGGSIELAGLPVPWDRFELAGLAVGCAAALWAYFRFTRPGLATRAAAEDERAAALGGLSPDALGAAAWALSGGLAGLFGILIAPVAGLNPVNFTLLVVPALAVALVGRLSSFGATCAAGLALGMAQSEIVYLQTESWYPDWAVTGASDALPFLVVIVTLFLVGRRLPGRGAPEPDRLPDVPRAGPLLRPALVLVTAGSLGLVLLDGSYRFGLIQSMILATIALSLVVLTGFVGQISLAQAAFAGAAGFALSKLAGGAGVPFPFSPLLAAGAAALLGLVVGLPALRIRGAQLAVVTLAAAVAIERFVFNNPSLVPAEGNLIPSPQLLGIDLGIRGGGELVRPAFGFLALAVLAAVATGVANLRRSGTGRRFLAVRSNERAAASVGIDVARVKLLAFVVSSFVAGLGGAMIGYSRGQLSGESFTVFAGLQLLVFAYVGGITSVGGALVAGALAPLGIGYVLLDRALDFGRYYLLFSGLSLVAITIFNPQGVAGSVRALAGRARPGFAARASVGPPRRRSGAAAAAAAGLGAGGLARAPAPRRAAERSGSALLELEDLSVAYGGQRAVDGVSLRVVPGAVVGLIGPNGAGKTSLIDAVTGFVRSSGQVRFAGHRIDGLPPHVRVRRGLARTWQSVESFGDLTVVESLRVGAERPRPGSTLLDLVRPGRAGDGDVRWVLALLGLDGVADRFPRELSLGQRKLAGVARAQATRPRLILLDEPAAGLDADESRELGARIRALADWGITVLLVDHDVRLVLEVCDVVHVLDFGALIASGSPAEIRGHRDVIAAYLGDHPTRPAPVGVAAEVGTA